jgi:hypothetical protein
MEGAPVELASIVLPIIVVRNLDDVVVRNSDDVCIGQA